MDPKIRDAASLRPVWPDSVDRPLGPERQDLKDVLDGLTLLYGSTFLRDLRNALIAYPDTTLPVALNKKQMASKLWLVDALAEASGGPLGGVHIQAGWYGVLAALLLRDARLTLDHVTVIDVDEACAPVALSLNATEARRGRFAFFAADVVELDYGALPPGLEMPGWIINTACEHLAAFGRWFAALPDGMHVVLQSNDYRVIETHVNCVDDLDAFRAQAPLSEELFAGALRLPAYTRFMLIGRK